uniref:FAT atypical cadherin 1a n=1 Tax=Cyprinus carpio TaxID=7962 RepID=A0A8C2E6F1_CYPCA
MQNHATSLLVVLLLLCSCTGIHSLDTVSVPLFTQSVYNATIYENSAAKTYVESPVKMGIYITDPTWEIRYKIVSGDNENLFKAEDYQLGDFSFLRIRTKGGSSAILNREVRDHYILTVKAMEKNSNAEARTRVRIQVLDTNDLRPLFSPTAYSISLPENTAIRTSVAKVMATDADIGTNGEYYYSFREWTDMFSVHPTSGVVTLTGKLDYSETKQYELEILAVDRGMKWDSQPFGYNLTLQAKDKGSPPQFSSAKVIHVTSPHFKVGPSKFTTDLDSGENGYVTYSIANVNPQPFVIDYFSGVISSSEILNYELMPRIYNLKVRASDWGSPFRREVETQVTVTLNNLNDNKPLFENVDCDVTVPRDHGVSEHITTVSAIDADELQLVRYRIKAGNDLNLFEMNPNSGVLSLKQSLTRKPVQVKCVDTGVASIVIEVKEDLPVGARIVHLSATDSDSGFNGKLVYVISGGDTESRFVIDMDSGWLKVYAPLDRETTDHYTLNITVYDLGIPQKSSSRLLDVKILDANDISPQFLQDAYSVDISESTAVGTEIIQVEAKDKDLGDNGVVRYSILADTDQFAIDMETGIVTVKKPLDREVQPSFILKIAARDQATGEPQLVSTVLLKITLEDVNDNPPKFIPPNYQVRVREDLPIGTVIMWLEAHDPDVGPSSQVRYSLADNGDGKFEVDKLSGAVRIVQNLDYEKKQVYSLTARAKDKGKPISLSSSCHIEVEVVDVNENLYRPLFPSYVDKGFIKEDVPIGTSVMKITAQDEDKGRDGEIHYSIRDGSGLGIFTIDEETGKLSSFPFYLFMTGGDVEVAGDVLSGHELFKKQISYELLDHETVPHYWLTVYATDRGVVPLSSFVEVYIEVQDVNDNAPQTSEPVYYPSVMENSPKDVSIIQIEAFDPDTKSSEKLSYKITSGNPQGFFSINPKTGLVTTTSRKLDREQQDEHILEITVSDQGIPVKSTTVRVIVKVLDENDNKPQFMEKVYKIKLPEREKPEKERALRRDPVYRVIASDRDEGPNAEISYSIEDGDEQGKFFIEPKTGMVSFKKFSSAGDYDILTIKAVDNGRPQKSSTCRLHIEWIPKPEPSEVPLAFDEPFYSFSVMESDPVAHMVGVITMESMETPVWFEITGGNSDSRFEVGKASGTVIVAQALDAEQKSHYNLTVDATDGTRSVSTQVIELLMKCLWKQSIVSYLFTYHLFLQVLIKVIDTNNHRPQFSKSKYEVNVPEDTPPDTEVLQITATDQDEKNKLTYTLLSRNVANTFAIDTILGTITVAKELDRSNKNRFELTVKASDKGTPPLSATAAVDITVTISDNAIPKFEEKEFSAEVSETALPGAFVSLVTANSQSSVFYQIKDGNVNGAFDINPNSGVVVTHSVLDYETIPSYKLTIQGTNMAGLASNTTLLIHLKDENDNAPIFIQEEFTGMVSESSPVNSVVLTKDNTPLVIRALDTDHDVNSRLVYQIVEPFAHNYFAIDSSTGAIRTISELDYEQRSVFRFSVQVHDMGIPRHFAEKAANVTIEVLDVNDCPPQFNQDLYETTVLVPTYKGVEVITVNATDADSGPNSRLFYSIVEGNIGEKFKMDPVTGVITIQNVTQLRSRYELRVRVSDGRFSKTALVKINVRENKESTLRFTQESYKASVPENSLEKKTLAVIVAVGNQVSEPLFYTILNPDKRFTISRTSGVLSSTGIPFDREEQGIFDIVVEVTREDKSSDIAHVLVTVVIEDVNDNPPVFVNLPYQALVQVDTEVGHIITKVTAVDADVDRNAEISYHLQELNEFIQISMDGEISLTKKLEKDSLNTEFVITVVARDGGEPALSSSVEVPIMVVNKAMPVFEKAFYSLEIPENIPLLTPVVHIQANDSEGPRIVYTITEGDPLNQFSINFNTGVIQVVKPLDFETHPAYKLSVRATDSLTGAKAEVFVDVILEDVNDNPPVFHCKLYNASLSEASVIGTSVLQVSATDTDTGNNQVLFYQIVEDKDKSSEYFSIDRDTGTIWTAQMLDHEEKPSHKLIIRAVDGGVPALSSEVIVLIDVTDLNDNTPVFSQNVYQATVSELAPRGHFVTQVQASDADSSDSGKLEFSIISGNEGQNFAVDPNTGAIVISNHRKPHMESLYNINVSVSDGVFRSSAIVKVNVISANFHNPTFNQVDYVVELLENSPVGTLVAEAQATDEDSGTYGRLTYHIVNDIAKDKFSISENGEIFTLESLDRENALEKVIPISLIAKDGGGKVGFCTVNVILTDINDNAPQFRAADYRVNVASDMPRGTTILKIAASDMDEGSNADITYSIEGDADNVEENFEIHQFSGVIVTKESLIGLENQLYTFIVRAKDGGNPAKSSVVPVYVRILVPEVPVPKFIESHYRFAIDEDLPLGSEIDVIQTESGQPVFYSLVKGNTPESNQDEVFVVDPSSGSLKLEKKLDHESTKWYQLTLQAQSEYDGNKVVSAVDISIQVKDVNDNRPLFESNPYEAYVVENLPGGTSVIQVKATDLDSGTNGHVVYNLDPNQETKDIAELFAINSETGWITTLKELDREKKNKYTVSVLATDRGDKVQLIARTKVDVTVVDVNDNPPRFTAEIYKGTVSEDDPPGGVIAILSTTDLDTEESNKQINYFITGGDPLGQFGIEHTQGEWKVSVRKPLDREEKDNYLLNVTATDGTFTAKAVVEVKVLDANDNSPICEKSFYMESVPEDSPAGRLILQVSATDADIRSNAQISYELLGAGSEHFSIDSETGELKTLLPLDREEEEAHKMKVRALDGGGRFCEAEVEITVEDVNDNAPQFTSDPYTFTVFENTEINTPVARLYASDLDTGSNAEVLYSLLDSADGVFSIDEETGVVRLDHPLDRELQSLYTLRARVTDRGSPRRLSSLTTVSVSILDINDNPPVFERREYTATIAEDIPVGTQVLQVHAASRDTEEGAEITYSIINGNERGAFRVDPHTGGVFVIEPLDYETAHEFYLTVEATDGGTPPLSDMATVNINLTDVNDNSPIFNQDIYSAVISEDAELGKTVLTVMADDADGPSSNQVRFSIIDGNQGSPFTIDPIRGEVKVARQLDREKTSGYTLTVLASDNGSPARSSSATVNIDVSDINDNPPLFSQANYSIIIQENQPVGTSILQLTVSDRDASHNGPPFTFSIISGNEGDAFQITSQGMLVSAATLSRQTQEFYLLQAQVTDSGRPPLVSTAFVSVRLIEESIYPPVILPLDIFITTATDEYSGGVLGKIHATDQDVYDTLTYSLTPDSSSTSENSGLFSVSPADGKLVARGNLDAGQYVLNITVTDGRFTAAARVNIHVRQATAQALDNSIAVRFSAIAPEEFIGDYWRNFLRALRNIAGVRRGDVQLVSLQPAADASGDLEVLLALERSGSPFQPQEVVYRKLNASVGVIEEMTGVRIVRVVKKLCAGLDCPLSYCQETVSLETGAVSAYSTARISFVTPRHMRTSKCLCEGAECPVLSKLCEGSPCPDGMECVEDPTHTKFKCICPEGKQEECSERQSLTFSGNGYARYRLMDNENKEEMKLSLRLRTFSTHATVMYAKGTDYSILEIVNGRLQYKFDCGSGPGVVSVHSTQVSDGQWHSVSLEVDGNYARLVLDQVHAASGKAPGTLRTLNLDTSMYFGGHARPTSGSGRLVVNGLRGCLEGIVFNGRELPLSQVRGGHSVLEELVEAAPGCSLAPPLQGCSSNPCTNGGTCSSLPNGGYFCKCTAAFMGTHCEVTISPCASNPCLYGGTCIPQGGDFYCQCRGQYSGQRCQLGPYCTDNPCKNSGKCIDSLDGPVCECELGFQGDRCLSDVDECLKKPCGNGGHCQNTYGSFNCNCSAGFSGQHCELRSEIRNEFVSTSWNIGLEEVIGIVVFVASIFILVILFVVVRKRICRRSKSKSDDDDKLGVGTGASHAFLHRPYFDSKLNKNIYSDIPPQVPVRPISYTPSIPSDSRNNLDRNSFEGSAIPEHPEFSTFNPDSVHGHRKTVAVCSVAPNLPPPPPSNSVSDSDSIQKPSWDYDYDAKVVDLDPCLSKKPVEDSACHPYNTRGSMSEVHSLSSFQSESCDDNGYHWDTSDWMPSVQLPGIQEFPQYEVVEAPPTLYSDPALLDTDYYPGGYDIENDFPPPPDNFPSHDDLPPPPPVPEYGERYDTLQPTTRALNSTPSSPGGSGVRQRPPLPQLYSLTQFLPHHHYSSDPEPQTNPTGTLTSSSTGGYRRGGFPLGYGCDFDPPAADNMSLSLYTSTASCSDMSACCEESEVMMSDYESGGEEEGAQFQRLVIPPLDSQHQQQQHTEV